MTTIHHASRTTPQAIAAHRFAVPVVREIAPVAASAPQTRAAARTRPDHRAPLRPERGPHTHQPRRPRAPMAPLGGRER